MMTQSSLREGGVHLCVATALFIGRVLGLIEVMNNRAHVGGQNMKRFLPFLLVGLAAIPFPSLCRAGGWTPPLTVSSTFTEASDIIVVYTSDGSVYTAGCAANSWIFAADTDPRRARMYATILTAIATGKKIQFWYSDSCGTWSYHQATSVMLVK